MNDIQNKMGLEASAGSINVTAGIHSNLIE